MVDLNHIVNELVLIGIYRTCSQTAADALFLCAHGPFTELDHILTHKIGSMILKD